jgi:hypothetical protein
MAILKEHLRFYREIFSIPGFFSEPLLTIGVQEIRGDNLPQNFNFTDFNQLLKTRGINNFETLDFFDNRATFKYDLNLPIPKNLNNKYKTLIDIGSIEHIFDTKEVLKNYIKMLKIEGILFIHTPINGYFQHGLYTFNPDLLVDAMKLNGFKIVYKKYSTVKGTQIKDPLLGKNVLIWLVAKKMKNITKFIPPQQVSEYSEEYWESDWKKRRIQKSFFEKLKQRIQSVWYACDLI